MKISRISLGRLEKYLEKELEDKRNIGSLGRKCKPEKIVEDSSKILGKNGRYLADSWNYNGDTGTVAYCRRQRRTKYARTTKVVLTF